MITGPTNEVYSHSAVLIKNYLPTKAKFSLITSAVPS